MTGAGRTGETGGRPQRAPSDPQGDTAADAPAPPVAQEQTGGPLQIAEFAERLDVDPERDDVKG